jgi:hypothetical protein
MHADRHIAVVVEDARTERLNQFRDLRQLAFGGFGAADRYGFFQRATVQRGDLMLVAVRPVDLRLQRLDAILQGFDGGTGGDDFGCESGVRAMRPALAFVSGHAS